MNKHLKFALQKIKKFKNHTHKNDEVEIKGGDIFNKNSKIWDISHDKPPTVYNQNVSYGNSASSIGANGGSIMDKLNKLSFGKKQKKIKF